MITRAQIRRQLRQNGGIMNAVPREHYGLGSFLKKAVGKIGKVAGQVIKSPIGKAALIGLGGAGLMGYGPMSSMLGGIGSKIGGGGIGNFFRGMGPKLFGTAAGAAAGPMSYLQKGVQQFTPGILGKLGITGGGGAMGLTGKGMLAGGGLLAYFMSKGKTEEEAKGLVQDVKRGAGMGLDMIKADMQKYRSGDLSESQAYNKGYHFLPQRQYMQAATGGRVGLYAGTPEEEIKSLDAGASSIKREGDVYPMDDDTTTQMYISDELGALPKKDGGVLPEDMGKLTITDFESKEDYNRYLRILHQGTRESLEENLPSQEDIKRFIPEDVLEERAQGGRIGYQDGEFVDKIYSPEARTLAGNIPEVRARGGDYAPTLFEEEEGGEWKYPGEVRPGQEYLTSTLQGANTMLDEMEMQKLRLTELASEQGLDFNDLFERELNRITEAEGPATKDITKIRDKQRILKEMEWKLKENVYAQDGTFKSQGETFKLRTPMGKKKLSSYAQGGRIGAQEGGLMNLGGMEKDYRQEGGFVPLGGEEKADDVPARLSKNEFVFTADAVRSAGGGDIDAGAEVMENVMNNLEQGGQISEESQGLEGARDMFATAQRLEGVI